jgi:hypothetical protein
MDFIMPENPVNQAPTLAQRTVKVSAWELDLIGRFISESKRREHDAVEFQLPLGKFGERDAAERVYKDIVDRMERT